MEKRATSLLLKMRLEEMDKELKKRYRWLELY
jgi:hypothetical protein